MFATLGRDQLMESADWGAAAAAAVVKQEPEEMMVDVNPIILIQQQDNSDVTSELLIKQEDPLCREDMTATMTRKANNKRQVIIQYR